MSKPIVVIAEELSPATISALGSGFDIKNCEGTNREELFKHLEDRKSTRLNSSH